LFFGAPVVIYITFFKDAYETKLFDLGLAAENIMIAAQLLGLKTVPVLSPRNYVPDLVKQELKIPDTEEFYVAIAVGYEDSTETDDNSKYHPAFGSRKTDNAIFIE
jgi:nitroreductase